MALNVSVVAIRRWALAALCGAGLASAEPPPISAFTDRNAFDNVEISPTGEYMAVTMAHEDGGATFRVLTHPDREIKINRNFDEGRAIADLEWVADSHLVVTPAERGLVFASLGITRELTTVAVKTGMVDRLAFGQLLDILAEDPKHILYVNTTDRFLEAYKGRLGGSSQRIARGAAPRGSLVPSAEGGIAFSTGRTADNQTEVYFREGRKSWQLLERHGYGEPGWVPLWYTAAPGKYFTRDFRDGPTEALGIYDARTGEHGPVVFRHPHADVGELLFDFGRRNAWGVVVHHHYPEVVYLAPGHPLARKHAMLKEVFPNDFVTITSSTRDHALSVALVTSDRKPGDFVLVDARAKKIDPIVSRRPNLTPDMLSPMSAVEFKVRDGTTVYGYVTSHRSTPRPGPMVVLVHGGPHGIRDYWGFNWEAQLLASRGYHVLQVNYRGSGGYGGSYLRAGFGEWGGRMQDDVTDATRWAVQAGIASADRICIFGGSYGGYAALMGAAREPKLYRCAIGYAGIFDLAAAEKIGDIRSRNSGLHYLKQVLGDDMAKRRERSPIHHAEKIQAAVMLVHGTLDRRTPLAHAQRMRDALRDAGHDVEWHVAAGQGHGIFGDEPRRDLYARVLAFLSKHIGDNQESGASG